MPGILRDGLVGSYNQTVGVKIDIDEAIDILTPSDVPLQQWAQVGPSTNETKVEWLEEDLTPQEVVVTSFTGTGPWVITVPDSSPIRPGDVLQERDNGTYTKQYLVTAVDLVANTVTASGFAGNAANPVNATTLQIVGQYITEGADPQTGRNIEQTTAYNYTQIMQEQVQVTRTARKRGIYGQGDPYDHEVMKKFKELAIRFERAYVLGYRTLAGDSTKRMMGGLFFYISTNSQSGVKANAYTLINALLKQTYEAGGTPKTLMVSPSVKAAISTIDASLRRQSRDESTAGFVVDHVLTDFGEVDVVPNRHFPKTKGLALQQEYVKTRPFDTFFHEYLAKTGDSEHGEIVGEYSIEVKNEKAHGVLTITDA